MSTQSPARESTGVLPVELVNQGWKLIRDKNQENPYRAKNEELQLASEFVATVGEAIEAARELTIEYEEATAIREEATATEPTPVSKIIPPGEEQSHICITGGGEYRNFPAAVCARCNPQGAVADYSPSSEGEAKSAVDLSADADEADELPPDFFTTPQMIAVDLIRTDGGTQTRAHGCDMFTVAEFSERMLAGAVFPPADVYFDGANIWLSDGFHRHAATIKAEIVELLCSVHQGTLRDAIRESLGANATHGLLRSNEDKRFAVRRALEDPEWSTHSDNAIAEMTKTSQPFVSKLRRELAEPPANNVLSEDADSGGQSPAQLPAQPTMRRGKDGVLRETKHIGERKTEDDRQTSLADVGVALPPREPAQSEIAGGSVSSEERTRTTGALTDLVSGKQVASPPAQASGVGEWPLDQVVFSVTVKSGNSLRRGIVVSGKVGDGTPIFRSEFTLADLQPLPPALWRLLGLLNGSPAAKTITKAATAASVPAKSKKTAPRAKKKAATKKPAAKKKGRKK